MYSTCISSSVDLVQSKFNLTKCNIIFAASIAQKSAIYLFCLFKEASEEGELKLFATLDQKVNLHHIFLFIFCYDTIYLIINTEVFKTNWQALNLGIICGTSNSDHFSELGLRYCPAPLSISEVSPLTFVTGLSIAYWKCRHAYTGVSTLYYSTIYSALLAAVVFYGLFATHHLFVQPTNFR